MYKHLCIAMSVLAGVVAFQSAGWTAPAAKVGSWVLDTEEIDKGLAGKFHELREERVQGLVLEHLLAEEAKAVKVDPSELLNKQVEAKVLPPTEEEVKKFIQDNKDRLPDGGKGMEDRIRGFLHEKKQDTAKDTYLKGLWDKYKVEILLQAPRFTVNGPQDLSRGKKEAPVTIIEFSDFECSYCRRAQSALKEVEATYGDKVRIVFRHYPLPFHKLAPKASEAAQCAAEQGQFWPFHDELFKEGASLLPADLKKLAGQLKLDQAKFDKCLDNGEQEKRVAADGEEGKRLGINGTPTFFINGKRLVGAVPLAEFKKTIDAELSGKK